MGTLALLTGLPAPLLMMLGSLGLVATFAVIMHRQCTLATVTMALGALLLLLLHASLLLRVIGDLLAWWPGRQWGGLLNALVVLLFVLTLAWRLPRGR